MDITTWQTQLRKGAVEAAVLGILDADGHAHGLAVLDRLNATGLNITEGALYPLLNRLEKSGEVAAEWIPEGGSSRPRKFYRLSDPGRELLHEMRATWNEFQRQIGTLLDEGTAQS